MKRVVRKVLKFFRLIKAIFNLIISRIKNSNKKRGVAQVVDSFNSGGLEQVAANMYKIFNEEGYQSSVICISNNVGPMCQQLNSPKHLRIVYYDIIDFINYCAKYNIRTLIFHFSTFHMILLKLLGFRNYYIVHNTYIWFTKNQWRKLKIKLKFTNGIIAVSDWCKDYFVQITGITKVKTILNGIDFNNLHKGEKTSYSKKNLKIKDDEIVCMSIAGYTEGKHQMHIIGIMEKIIEKNKKIKFICAGPILNPKLFKRFEKKVKASKAAKNIIILDYVPQEEIGDFIRTLCDIYVQPSIHEAGVPLTVKEALLNAKPVVMTDFMLKKSFPNCSRLFGVEPAFESILKITPEIASKMSYKTNNKSTKEFANKILEIAENMDYYKNEKNFNVEEFNFLDLSRMAKEYIEFIKI